eukprot:31480-Pelagococcus_subviridis.AAC.12
MRTHARKSPSVVPARARGGRELRGHRPDRVRRLRERVVLRRDRDALRLRVRVLLKQHPRRRGVVQRLNQVLLQPSLHAVHEKVHHRLRDGVRENAARDGKVRPEEDARDEHLEELLVRLRLARLDLPRGFFQRHDAVFVRVELPSRRARRRSRRRAVLLFQRARRRLRELLRAAVDVAKRRAASVTVTVTVTVTVPAAARVHAVAASVFLLLVAVKLALERVAASSRPQLSLREPHRDGAADKVRVRRVDVRELAVHEAPDHRLGGVQPFAQKLPRRRLDRRRQPRIPRQLVRLQQRARDSVQLVVHDPRRFQTRVVHLLDRLLHEHLERLLREEQRPARAGGVLNRRSNVLLAHRLRGVQALEPSHEDVLQDVVDPSPALEVVRVQVVVPARDALHERRAEGHSVRSDVGVEFKGVS